MSTKRRIVGLWNELALDAVVLQVHCSDPVYEQQWFTVGQDSLDRSATIVYRLNRWARHVEWALAQLLDQRQNVQ
jgi:hypothetical protein